MKSFCFYGPALNRLLGKGNHPYSRYFLDVSVSDELFNSEIDTSKWCIMYEGDEFQNMLKENAYSAWTNLIIKYLNEASDDDFWFAESNDRSVVADLRDEGVGGLFSLSIYP